MHRTVERLKTTERPKVRTADAGRRLLDVRIGRFEDFGFGDVFAANIARAV
jgi:hypothetical protein